MYRVLCDDIPIFDPRDEELVLINPVIKPELNSSGSFEFKIPPAHPQKDVPVRMLSTVQVFQDGCGPGQSRRKTRQRQGQTKD